MSSENKKTAAGCFGMVLHMAIVFPLWLAVVYGVLSASDPEPWVWYVFYTYIPANVVVNIVRGMMNMMAE